LQEQKEILAGQLGEIQEENEKLKEEISFSNTPDFIERMARTILGWVKPGEIKYVVGETPDGD
jgi:cell division protein FtsB